MRYITTREKVYTLAQGVKTRAEQNTAKYPPEIQNKKKILQKQKQFLASSHCKEVILTFSRSCLTGLSLLEKIM